MMEHQRTKGGDEYIGNQVATGNVNVQQLAMRRPNFDFELLNENMVVLHLLNDLASHAVHFGPLIILHLNPLPNAEILRKINHR